ncbi:hypothetical protein [Mesorhizobium sp.]|uniref:hypothetical protein n=1 Tax=Mesorhizobium sp. TaxID=1871066 RepID=UPI000FE5A86C|nr:hypothetical protein [Mesorhizobium sp.]RWI66745.1 MAG: hypothetical protein EOR19_31540 [Mesorhizobium sp.]TIN16152.1 MAG: hypothetical protein E5Y51_15495 [Mesorhizobium sp.]
MAGPFIAPAYRWRYTERLAKADIKTSVSGVGDSHDNALAGTMNGLHKPQVIIGAVRDAAWSLSSSSR